MTGNEYLANIIQKYKAPDIDAFTDILLLNPLRDIIKDWAGDNLSSIVVSGSRAKGTAISLSSDLDWFISLKSDTTDTLSWIYNTLFNAIEQNNVKARKQNVSIGIEYAGYKIDLVPGRIQQGYINYHSLYKQKTDSWTQTNIAQHISLVKNSGRIDEIIIIKIWRHLHNLDFPSIYLELAVLDALYNRQRNQLENNVQHVLEYLSKDFIDTRIVDPSNSNNIISDDLYKYEKQAIANKAREGYDSTTWANVVW